MRARDMFRAHPVMVSQSVVAYHHAEAEDMAFLDRVQLERGLSAVGGARDEGGRVALRRM